MKFSDLLTNSSSIFEEHAGVQSVETPYAIIAENKKAEEIIRAEGYKIKLVTKTAFGTQIDLAKKYDEEDIRKVLKDFNIKFKNNSLFIVD